MTDTVTVVTNPSTNTVEIVSVGPQGPQGPQGVKGDVGDVNPDMITLRDAAAASASAAAGSASSASTSATTATTQASSASGSASTATSQATIATNQATTATTKAGEASTSATNAAASAGTASSSATTATTKASEASTSASNAAGSASTAISQATIATTKAAEADASATAAAGSASSASTSAATASTQATNAANSQSTATSAAATATTQATNASTSAATATTKANDAANSATTAQNAATTASTQANSAIASAAAAAASQSAAAVSESGASAGAATSTAKASEAAGSAAAINATFGNAASVALQAQNAQSAASLAQGYAASASSVVQQDLSGITAQALHRSPNAITAQFIYDTSKDSDGGAWTEKCQGTSWYNEALAGKWLGPQASESDARFSGATLGSELVTNGNFSSGTGWTVGSGWAISGGTLNYSGAYNASYFTAASNAFVAGKYYRVTMTISGNTSGNVNAFLNVPNNGALNPVNFSGNGEKTFFLLAGVTCNGFHFVGNSATGAMSIDNISIREVTALNTASNDYFQLTTDGKFYRLWKNIFQYSSDFTNAVWTKGSLTSVSATTFTGGTSSYIQQNVAIPGGTAGRSFTMRAVLSGTGKVRLKNTQSAVLDTFTSDITLTSTPTAYTLAVTNGSSAGNGFQSFGINPATDNSAFTVTVAEFQAEYGTVATSYEAKAADASTSEIFRGNKADFPRLAAIVAEEGNVNIYDLTEPGRPMWMRFFPGNLNERSMLNGSYRVYSSTPMLNGIMPVGSSGAFGALRVVDFPRDTARSYRGNNDQLGGTQGNWRRDIASRNTTAGYEYANLAIAGDQIYAVAMTVLPDAPIDPATGLRVPTIAVATGGGVSVIKHNGTVQNLNVAANYQADVAFNRNSLYVSGVLSSNLGIYSTADVSAASIGAVNYFATYGFPQFQMTAGNEAPQFEFAAQRRLLLSRPGIGGVSMLIENRASGLRSIAARVTPTFNTGWLTGDIRRAYLSDVTAESISGSELVTNGTFATDLSGWTDRGTLSTWVSGTMQVSGNGASYGSVYTPITTVVGRSYVMSVNVLSVNRADTLYLGAGSTTAFSGNRLAAASGVATYTFTATSTTTYIKVETVYSNSLAVVDNVSVVEAVLDRSYKAASAPVFGTLTKAQLATGTSLVGYSGFSASNYLREPYSADLDFGTGEWNASAWVNVPTTLPTTSYPLGSELVDTANTATAWITYGTNTVTQDGDAVRVTFGSDDRGAYIYLTQAGGLNANLVAGKSYQIQVQLRVNSGSANFAIYGTSLGNYIDPAAITQTDYVTRTYIFTYVSGNPNLQLSNLSAGEELSIRNVSVRELGASRVVDRSHSSGPYVRLGVNYSGTLTAEAFDGTTTRTVTTTAAYNTATWLKADANYTTDGSLTIRVNGREVAATRGNPLRPYYGRKNLLNYSHTFSNAIWVGVFGGAKVSTNNSDPDGGTNAVEISFANQYAYLLYNSVALFVSGQQYTLSFWARRSSGSNAISVYADPSTLIGSYSPTSTWTRYSITFTWSGASAPLMIAQDRNASGFTNVQLYGFQLELGAAATTYTPTTDVPPDGAPLTIGNNYAADAPFPGTIALLKLGATVPTPEQATFMYEQEKQLFRANAQCVMPDSGSIVDMAYDDATDRWVAVSAANESYWTGLVRNTVTPVPAGSYTKIVATSGIELAARSTTNPGVDVTIPAYGLREELVKRAEAAARLGKELSTFDYVGGFTGNTTSGSTAIASVSTITYPGSYIGARISGSGIPANTTIVAVSGTTLYISAAATATATGVSITFLDFALPAGMETKTVMSAGSVKQEGSTKDYTRLYDGFIETIRFGAAPGVTAWVQIAAQRITLQ